MTTQVNPALLQQAALRSENLATEVSRAAAMLARGTESSPATLPGWRTARALTTLHAGWADALARHRGYLDALGGALSACASTYRTADATSASRFNPSAFTALDTF